MTLTLLLWCSVAGAGPLDGGAEPAAGGTQPAAPLVTTAEPAPVPPHADAEVMGPAAGALPLAISVAAALLAVGSLVQSSLLAAKMRKLEGKARSSRPARGSEPRGYAGAAEPEADDGRDGTVRVRSGEPARTAPFSRPEEVRGREAGRPVSPSPSPIEPTPRPEPRAEPRPDPVGLNRAGFVRPSAAPSAEPERSIESSRPAASAEATQAEAWLRNLFTGQHGAIGAAIGAVYLASAELAGKYRDANNREEFVRIAQAGLKSRLGRFTNAQRGPAADFHHDWVEPDLIPILDGLSNLYSRALAEVRAGNVSAAAVAARLHDVLYLQVGPACHQAGWFSVQVIVPFETEFDPIRHSAIGSAEAPGASHLVVDIRQAGRLDAVSGTVLAAAHVVVGR